MRHLRFYTHADLDSRSFLLQRVQPALSGLMDGSLSTLAPIFAVVLATHRPLTAFYTGLATALGAGVSMAFSEGLSDTGDLTGRGSRLGEPDVATAISRPNTALAIRLGRGHANGPLSNSRTRSSSDRLRSGGVALGLAYVAMRQQRELVPQVIGASPRHDDREAQ